ncbi:MAG: hypothetical protein KDN22_11720 [Verrucomicrobiae bacterium]|nr:hypothetical protein [Verrucomicrobiae bacterium]
MPVPHVPPDNVSPKICGTQTGLRPKVVVVEDIEPPIIVIDDGIVRADTIQNNRAVLDLILRNNGAGGNCAQ